MKMATAMWAAMMEEQYAMWL